MERLVVIGGVAAGMSAASSFKRLKPDAEAIVLERDHFISYGACSLPYYISDEIEDINTLLSLTPEAAEKERGITVLTRHEAISIDPVAKTVTAVNLDAGEKKMIPYDRLVIATGGLPIRPLFPGVDLEHVFTLRNLHDGVEIKKFINHWLSFEPCVGAHCVYENPFGIQKRPMQAAIVGGGSIGMEMCEALRKRGVEVTVFEKMDRVLGTMDTSITDIIEERISAEGVTLRKGYSVEAFEADNSGVARVATDKGIFAADMVLLVIGARPNTSLAVDVKMELGAAGAIKVDDHLRTSIPDIYAAGDCAETKHIVTGKKVYIPLGPTANKQGRIAGENAAGMMNIFEGVTGTAVTKIFDLEVARTGLAPLEASREDLDYFVSIIKGRSRSSSYPQGKRITVTYIVEKGSGRLLGAQMAGAEGVAHRIDTLATALYNKMTVSDIARLDLAYAPPFATVWDPILVAANVAVKRLQNEA
ncbi:MAG: flavoprotein oxidoreductase [Deltaproteobacteria bacterium]|nr:flavoprotein oxidoreductase [Deltaproteobacteria bacterium]